MVQETVTELKRRLPNSQVNKSTNHPNEIFVELDEDEIGQFYKAARELDLDPYKIWRDSAGLGGWVKKE